MDIMRPSNYSVRPDLVYTVTEKSKDIVEWTEAHGAVWTIDAALYYGQTAHRMHTTDNAGKGLTDALIASMGADPNITQMLECEMMGLVLDDDGETVVGAYGKSGGDELAIMAKNTVLASSGFANNPDMLAQYCPEAVDAFKMVAPGATGEGILWAQELGAELQNMGAYQGHAFHGVDNGQTLEQGVANNGGIIVNQEGNRFMSEYGGYSELSPHVLAQTDHIAYLCFTDAQKEKSVKYPDWEEAGIVLTGATPAELGGGHRRRRGDVGEDHRRVPGRHRKGRGQVQPGASACELRRAGLRGQDHRRDPPHAGRHGHRRGGARAACGQEPHQGAVRCRRLHGGLLVARRRRLHERQRPHPGVGLRQDRRRGGGATEDKESASLVEWTKSDIDAYR